VCFFVEITVAGPPKIDNKKQYIPAGSGTGNGTGKAFLHEEKFDWKSSGNVSICTG